MVRNGMSCDLAEGWYLCERCMLKVQGATSGAIGGEFHFFTRVCGVYFYGDPVHFLHSYRHIVDRVK